MSPLTLLLLPGDGIGPEIFGAMEPIFRWLKGRTDPEIEISERLAGYRAFTAEGATISDETLQVAAASSAVLFGAESTEEYVGLPRADRPESCLLKLRKGLGGYANLRPVKMHPALEMAVDAALAAGGRTRDLGADLGTAGMVGRSLPACARAVP